MSRQGKTCSGRSENCALMAASVSVKNVAESSAEREVTDGGSGPAVCGIVVCFLLAKCYIKNNKWMDGGAGKDCSIHLSIHPSCQSAS